MKYIVMECHKAYAVLLDEDGRFVNAANMNYTVGQTVTDPFLMKQTVRKGFSKAIWSGAIAVIAACFILVLGLGYYQNNLICYSSITMSINPEVRIDLNRKGEVIDVVGTNADGVKLTEGYSFKGKNRVTVADELIDLAREQGYLENNNDINFDINSPDQKLLDKYSDEISRQVTAYLTELFDGANPTVSGGHITITIVINTGTNPPSDGNGNTDTNPPSGGSEDTGAEGDITAERAKEIALGDANLSASDISEYECSVEEEDGETFYEIEFSYGDHEYEYKIDLETGKILYTDLDADEDADEDD